MQINKLKPRKALNKAYLKVKPNRTEIEGFKANLIQLIDQTNDTESEEFHKNLVSDFLKKTYYHRPTDGHEHFINTKGRNDLVIHNGKDPKSTVGVIIEAKKPTNKTEMMTCEKLNTKAFHELLLYYLRERISLKNLEIKYLIATNINEWFVFNVDVFERNFAEHKKLVKQFEDFEEGRLAGKTTDFFYNEIAEPFIAALDSTIEFTHFDLKDYDRPLRNDNPKDDNRLIALFKLLSPEHLLNLSFANDSNSLDKRFYSELLHIIGLEEVKEGGKKVIHRKRQGNRNGGSLLENAITIIEERYRLENLDKPSKYGANTEEQKYNVALELCITWVNRILFLKLLESQLVTYHKGDKTYAFLNVQTIPNNDALDKLFFSVLARKYEDRNDRIKRLFNNIPYLNSSLFEETTLERKVLEINQLDENIPLPTWNKTILKDKSGKAITENKHTLTYLLEFLDAYDFSSEGSENIQEDNKTLINASVLGLIFEKINGYKDGSFFTPGFITMYMCRETIRRSVVQRFNDRKGWNCKDYSELKEDLQEYIKSNDRSRARTEANQILNSLKICDPAVGSGHFLVSALNEMIAIKSDLKILVDREGERISDYDLEVVNDELVISNIDEDRLFEYRFDNKKSQRLQEALFHEKQTIIENCLFGVDINPNSVKICRLRLWIELLKNAYYKNATELETLPNIDINIKCGNSLISRYDLGADIKDALKKGKGAASRWTIDSYRIAVASYRNAQSKEEKREMERLISDIKSDFRSEIAKNDPKAKRLYKLTGELANLTTQTSMFEMGKKEKTAWKKRVAKLTSATKKLETEIVEIKNNKIYENAFEWRFEFPEVLNDDGDFVGFDTIIGNPPYIRYRDYIQQHKKETLQLEQKFNSCTSNYDLYVPFMELGYGLTSEIGEVSYILPHKWMVSDFGKALRGYLSSKDLVRSILSFGHHSVFEDATTYTSIISLNRFEKQHLQYAEIEPISIAYSKPEFEQIDQAYLDSGNWNLKDSNTLGILRKLDSLKLRVGDVFDRIFQGLATSSDKVFILKGQVKEGYLHAYSKQLDKTIFIEAGAVKPFIKPEQARRFSEDSNEDYFVIFPYKLDEGLASPYLQNELKTKFPRCFEYLKENQKALRARESGRFDNDDEWFLFSRKQGINNVEQQKIICPEIANYPNMILDSGKFYHSVGCYSFVLKSPNNALYTQYLGLLNSKLLWFFIKATGNVLRGGYYRFKTNYLKPFPIPDNLPQEGDDRLISLVTQILVHKKENPAVDTSALEAEIDCLVYELYELTPEEIEIVENAVK